MKMKYKIFAFMVAFLTIPGLLLAADTAGDVKSSFNVVLISLVSLVVILTFAIAVLANVLKNLAYAYRDKLRAKKKEKTAAQGAHPKTLALLAILCLSSFSALAQDAVAEEPVRVTVIAGMKAVQFYFLIGLITLQLAITIALTLLIRVMVRNIVSADEDETELAAQKAIPRVSFWDKFNKAVEIEKEQDILLDHDYDGIRELDNSLPPWWKYGFYLTILISVVYIWYYHLGGDGPSSHEEYVAAMEKAEKEKAAYLAKAANNIDENTVTMSDAAGIAAGQKLYQSVCAACHAADGGGGVGPNLADPYWLHGGSLSDVFKSIKYGWPDKGMKSWKDDFSPKQIADITSFVMSLQGTTPAAPKEKQGDLYIPPSENADSQNETNQSEI